MQVAEHLDADGLVQATHADRVKAAEVGGIFRALSWLRSARRKSWPPAAKFAASVLPMLPVPMMAIVWSEKITLVCLS